MQAGPHDGVAALAEAAPSVPAAPTPPTRVSVAAAASTLLLMDMNVPLLELAAVPCARPRRAGPRSTRRSNASDPLGTLPAHGGLVRTRNGGPDRSLNLFGRGKAPGKPGSPSAVSTGHTKIRVVQAQ